MGEILKFSNPCEAGLNPRDIIAFLDDIKERKLMVHSLIIMRGGKVCAEGYWKPFDKDFKHRMYSVSKTFVAMAIGALIGEGKLSLDTKIAPYFTDKIKGEPDPWMADLTVRDCLMMETCHAESTYRFTDKDWLATFFETKPNHPSGTFFRYDTSGTYTLDVLVERITGKPFLKYLQEKALDEIGYSKDAFCIEAPEGITWGGSGVMCTTRDLARFLALVDADGAFEGKQLLPADFVAAAKAKQIDNAPYGYCTALQGHGYGYKIWRVFGNGYAFEGMGGQLAISWPDKDLMLVTTADMQGHNLGYDILAEAFRYNIYNKLTDTVAPDPEGEKLLAERLAALEPELIDGDTYKPFAEELNGKTYQMAENKMGIKTVRFDFEGDELIWHYDTVRGEKELRFGLGKYIITEFPETQYSGRRIRTSKNAPYRCMTNASWSEDKQLHLRVYVIDEYFGNMIAVFGFKGDEMGCIFTKYAEDFMDEYNGMGSGKRIGL